MTTVFDLDSIWRDKQAYANPCDYIIGSDHWTKWAVDVNPLPPNASQRPKDFVSSVNLLGATLPYPRIELFAKRFITVVSISANTFTTATNHDLSVNDIVITSSPGYTASNKIQRNVEYHVVAIGATTFTLSLLQGGAVETFTNGTGLGLEFAVITPSEYASVTNSWYASLEIIKMPRLYIDIHCVSLRHINSLRTVQNTLSEAKFVLVPDKVHYDDTLTPLWLHFKSSREQVFRFDRSSNIVVKFMRRDGSIVPYFNEADPTIPTNPAMQSIITFDVTPYTRDAHYTNHGVEPLM